MFDAALYYGEKAERSSQILRRLGLRSKDYVLTTMHRHENVDDYLRLSNIPQGFAAASAYLQSLG